MVTLDVEIVHQTHLLEELLKCGMDIVRINIAHGTMNSAILQGQLQIEIMAKYRGCHKRVITVDIIMVILTR
jgi:pyruvate kinase